ncbi:MAG: hypothetical protein KIS62_17295 [Ramlibacter sp.]|nr:hypothetical protein [Ramlibacter sp.]MBX3657000.1 hypothetical protein [Ramlibacter sp.]MCW5651504.1 hypothetical protein [Ramlibacter sp.]
MSGTNSSHPDAGDRRPPEAFDEPLGLTVHSMPTPQEAAAGSAGRTLRGRWQMMAVLLVCAAPVVASYFTYYVVRPEGRRNYGELIEPQRPLPDLTGTTPAGQPVNLRSLKGQWLLVSVAGGACDAACEKHLYLQRQLREGLGKDKDRVDWVWLVPDATPVREALLPALRQATVLRVDPTQLAQWLTPSAGHQLHDQLYLVDPLGNWMMRFPPVNLAAKVDASSAARIKKDLERVLRASASWDEAGRPAQ